jgi:hypothetical protein
MSRPVLPGKPSVTHPPLSEDIRQVLTNAPGALPMTLNELMQRTHGRGIFLVIILLSLPFIAPIGLAGLSNVLGCVIMLLALRLALGLPPRLPRFMGDRPLPTQRLEKIARGSVKFLQVIEKWVRPRQTEWMTWTSARRGNALLLAFMAFLLALPIPPLILFSNTLPSYAIILLAASMMEEDGVLIWFGYAMSLATVIYLAVVADAIVRFFAKHFDRILHFFQSWL